MTKPFDVAVIGGGIAGLTAVHHALLGACSVAHIAGSGPTGGLVCNVGMLHGFPSGDEPISGSALASAMAASNETLGASVLEADATSLEHANGGFRIGLEDGQVLRAGQVIGATGARLRMLDVPGARELIGQGVSQCAWCDGPLYKGKDVVVIGGGDAALEEALHLAKFAARLTIITRGENFRARQAYVNQIAMLDNVEFRWMSDVLEILGSEGVEAIRLFNREDNAEEHIPCSGVFVFVGLEPNSNILEGLADLDGERRIVTTEALKCRTPGLYAVGAVRSGYRGRLIQAVGEAGTAAMEAVAQCA
jgi:thioredoxin reductase (NADPH)